MNQPTGGTSRVMEDTTYNWRVTKIDSDAGEPDHDGAEEDALRGVHEKWCREVVLLLVPLREHWRVIQHGRQHVHCRNCHLSTFTTIRKPLTLTLLHKKL